MAYHFDKGRKPRGASWPLLRSRLDSALEEASVTDLVTVVYYWVGTDWRSAPARLLRVRYHGEQVPGFHAGQVAITVWAVPSPLRHEAERQMTTRILPSACQWIAEIPNRPSTWRSENASVDYRLE